MLDQRAVPRRRGGNPFPGWAKVDFCRRMQRENVRELADLYGISPVERERFPPGDQVAALWELVESRDRLGELPDHLDALGHTHLAEALRRSTGDTPTPPNARPRAVGGRPAPIPGARRRLLIVEDNDVLGRTLMIRLRPEFDCTLVRSLEEWDRLTADGPLDFDGALVDRHLEQNMNDGLGLHVLEYLRDHTDTRSVLMTADTPAGFESESVERYGVVGVYRKGEGNAGINVRIMIDRLFSPGG
ncbi:hypothetical protein [Micromonospora robiginosa]|uniref:Response regulatory domain-containing protein n=1 Tax=Micromonospora robiginosa TaxID=2749844 RepID=A0A7L6BCI4_9ACTN|nr:hypothetical protein [Micromonospora ferruginea]QLQ39475.1 hypothetical protein H1D33_11955 [Micromonospora ferruginea]